MPHRAETNIEAIKLIIIGSVTFLAGNFNQIISEVFGVLSVAYLLWKWRIDYKKYKKDGVK